MACSVFDYKLGINGVGVEWYVKRDSGYSYDNSGILLLAEKRKSNKNSCTWYRCADVYI